MQTTEYRADGALRYTFYCHECKKYNSWSVFSSQLQHSALYSDLEKCLKTVPNHPLRPPLAPSSSNEESEDDSFLRGFGIGDPKDSEEGK
jgi:hypothetical protein